MTVEQYAVRYGRLHPKAIEFLSQYFERFDLGRVKVSVKPGVTSAKDTSVWVLASTIIAQRGKFNAKFEQWSRTDENGVIWHDSNRALDLATIMGMRILAHECYHVQQWLTRPWWSIWAVAWAALGSITGRSWHSSKWEKQAIEFEHSISNDIALRYDAGELEVFETLRT